MEGKSIIPQLEMLQQLLN